MRRRAGGLLFGLLGGLLLLSGAGRAQQPVPPTLVNPCSVISSTYQGQLVTSCLLGGTLLTVTDGTNTVQKVGKLTFSGVTVGGTSPNATVAVGGSGGSLLSATVALSSAQILNLGAVAVQLIAPPGANKYINIVKIACYTVYGTQTFTDTDGAFIAYGDFSTGLSVGGGTISSAITANASMVNETPVQLTSVDAIRIANVGLNVVDQSSPTGGDSSVVVNVLYTIITAP